MNQDLMKFNHIPFITFFVKGIALLPFKLSAVVVVPDDVNKVVLGSDFSSWTTKRMKEMKN